MLKNLSIGLILHLRRISKKGLTIFIFNITYKNMKKEIILSNDGWDYITRDGSCIEPVLCGPGVQKILGETPFLIKITVTDKNPKNPKKKGWRSFYVFQNNIYIHNRHIATYGYPRRWLNKVFSTIFHDKTYLAFKIERV